MTHRGLVAAALADGRSVIRNPLDADDTRVTLAGLKALGVRTECSEGAWIVQGRGRDLPGGGTLQLAESGTSMRFLAALAALGRASSTLDGSPRLRERPVHELVEALRELGGSVEATPGGGGLPVRAGGARVAGGRVRVPAGRSSQFASALLLIGSRLDNGLDLTLEPPAVSLPYIELTVGVLEAFGVGVERPESLRWHVSPGGYSAREFRVDGDHSSASYFLAAAAIVGGRVRMEELVPDSAQADARLGGLLAEAGCEVRTGADWIEVRGGRSIRGFDLDMGAAPDLVPTVAVLAMFSERPSVLRGIEHLRIKESDRLETLASNLRRLGCESRAIDDRLEIRPDRSGYRGALIETASDHRMAMAFAVAGLVIDGVLIDDPACVSKSNAG
ncbi:MAG: 3-phosphoshikimate 1-carboxyvinyltransferase, partial [Planctomycetota bacterium]